MGAVERAEAGWQAVQEGLAKQVLRQLAQLQSTRWQTVSCDER